MSATQSPGDVQFTGLAAAAKLVAESAMTDLIRARYERPPKWRAEVIVNDNLLSVYCDTPERAITALAEYLLRSFPAPKPDRRPALATMLRIGLEAAT